MNKPPIRMIRMIRMIRILFAVIFHGYVARIPGSSSNRSN